MSEYYSTQSSLEARISALRLSGLIDYDDDGSLDDDGALLAGQKMARGLIRGKLEPLYGETEIATWDSDTVPELVGQISDDLCIYQFLLTNPRINPANYDVSVIRANALELLDQIAASNISLYGVDPVVNGENEIGRIPSDFDPERDLDDMTVKTTWILPDNRELSGY